ncbi:MAG TPA: hypothetical protein VM818_11960 [Vicinamibacterales bacterium]|nr:hypothetical protein [Vicinamibacterales bacterium]
MDFTPSGEDVGTLVTGFDAFAFELAWWRANRWRFRPYILGEPCWDNVYAALLMCHGVGRLVNKDAVIRHEKHAATWGGGAFAEHNSFLASLDARYFTLWATYHARLLGARTRNASDDDERAIASDVFVWRPSPGRALWQAGRSLKARIRYRKQRARWSSG